MLMVKRKYYMFVVLVIIISLFLKMIYINKT